LVVDETGIVGFGTVDPACRLEVLSAATDAVRGYSDATTGLLNVVFGQRRSNRGRGVFGYASQGTGTTYGVFGRSSSSSGRGVYGYASAGS